MTNTVRAELSPKTKAVVREVLSWDTYYDDVRDAALYVAALTDGRADRKVTVQSEENELSGELLVVFEIN